MSDSETRVYLRGVDFHDVLNKYLNNTFINLITPLPVDISALDSKPQKIVTIKENLNSVSYQVEGLGQSFACIGYKVSDCNGNYAVLDPNKEYRCMFCLKNIKNGLLGIPIRREEKGNKIYFHMIDIFCTFNCVLAEIRRRSGNSLYSHSSAYISEIYRMCTGKDISEVKMSSDPRLLEIYNGPLTWDQYHSASISYTEKPSNVYFLPVIEYIEQT